MPYHICAIAWFDRKSPLWKPKDKAESHDIKDFWSVHDSYHNFHFL